MVDLNDVKGIRALDSLGSLAATEDYPAQFALGLELAEKWQLPEDMKKEYDEIVVLGTGGGSSIAGALLTSLFFHQLKQPVIINQGYTLPAFADNNTLAIAISHSGNTEEILATVAQAQERGCPMLAITAGGKLADICQEQNIPVVMVPRDIGHPRRNLGYIVPPLVAALARLGLVDDISEEIRDAIKLMEDWVQQYRVETPLEQNPAKQLALSLKGHIPLVYGSSEHLQAPAWRWKNQFGENSKMMAFYNLIPHLHHDEAVGWDMEEELLKKFFLIMLRDSELDDNRIAKRKDITTDMLRQRLGGASQVFARGQSLFARLFSLITLGDFVSLYAAIARGIDPTPVEVINLFKEKMAQ